MSASSDRRDRVDLDVVGSLAEPNRRALYDYVTSRRGWVSREDAADGVGLQRGIAAHHLDRLAADGLLEVDYQRQNARSGPGAGRPAKVYRRALAEFRVNLPPRHYDLAGSILADAADCCRRDGTPMDEAIDRAAGAEGRRIGAAAQAALGRRTSPAARRACMLDQLRLRGFEPELEGDGAIVLHNCPFHLLAQQHTDLICGMNLRLFDGILAELGDTGLEARLEPSERSCCVRLRPIT
jgi:predicted ArsR family transcriptional regulator